MSIEFQGCLYPTVAQCCSAIVFEWITASGSAPATDVADFLRQASDDEIANELIGAWGLDATSPPLDPYAPEQNWMAARGIDQSDIVAAVARYRAYRMIMES